MSLPLRPWREHLPKMILPSSLLNTLRDKADWPPTARFDEHRPKCNNKFHHACASGEHKRPTAFVFPLPACALREHGRDVRILRLLFWCAAFGEHKGTHPWESPNYTGHSSSFHAISQNIHS
jgi:hypothetical protein